MLHRKNYPKGKLFQGKIIPREYYPKRKLSQEKIIPREIVPRTIFQRENVPKGKLSLNISKDKFSIHFVPRSESSKSKVSDFTKEKMKEWLKDDYKVYNHFKTKLETNIEDFGALNLSRELAKYHQLQDKIKAKCPIQFVPKSSLPVDDRPFGFGTEAYKILNRDPECQFLGMQELKFTSFLRKQQSNRLKLRK